MASHVGLVMLDQVAHVKGRPCDQDEGNKDLWGVSESFSVFRENTPTYRTCVSCLYLRSYLYMFIE